jgi:hypothetical protein
VWLNFLLPLVLDLDVVLLLECHELVLLVLVLLNQLHRHRPDLLFEYPKFEVDVRYSILLGALSGCSR